METIETLLARRAALRRARRPRTLDADRGLRDRTSASATGELLFREGDQADTFYLVRARQRRARDVRARRAGRSRSRRSRPARWSAGRGSSRPTAGTSTRARSSLVRATAFDGACLRGKCESDPRLGYELMSRFAQVLIERLQWTRLRLLDVYGYDGAAEPPLARADGAACRSASRGAGARRATRGRSSSSRRGRAARVRRPGQFTMLYAFGIGEVPISVSRRRRRPARPHRARGRRGHRGDLRGSKPGAVLGVRGPFGNAWPVEEAVGGDVVVVAGGIGLAPLRPALYDVARAGAPSTARSALLYGSRTPGDLLYATRARALARRLDLRSTSRSTRPTAAGAARSASCRSSIAGARFDPATRPRRSSAGRRS